MARWKFNEIGERDLEQRPHHQEFFRDTPKPEAFVREVIQNSLDAKRDGSDKVKVLFSFDKAPLGEIYDYVEDLGPHLDAWDILPSGWGSADHLVPFLTIEDFGTTGLTGPTSRNFSKSQKNEHFLSFWLRDGMSEKQKEKGGRWGLGKHTFFMVSKINTFWGLTIRDDGKEYLMGKSALKPHNIGEKRYTHYGFFRDENDDPVTDENLLNGLKKEFSLKRKTSSGLSLVIPYPISNINHDSLLKSVMIHYFYPILRDNLVVSIQGFKDGIRTDLNRKNFRKKAKRIDWDGTEWENKDVDEFLKLVINGIKDIENGEITRLPDKLGENWTISKDDINEDLFEDISKKFNSNRPITLSLPVCIKKKSEDKYRYGDFFLFLKKYNPDEMSGSEEHYIRSGIRLPEESKRYNRLGRRPVRGLLVVENDDVVSPFLADAEVPAHTHWNEQTEGFQEKYEKATNPIRYIRNSMKRIVGLLIESKKESYEGLLQDFFSVVGGESMNVQSDNPSSHDTPSDPGESDNEPESVEDDKEGEETDPSPGPDTHPESSTVDFSIRRIDGGFKIKYTGDEDELPVTRTLRAAYDIHRGNPFNQYEPFDFTFSELNIDKDGVDVLDKNENELEFRVFKHDSYMKVTGFDVSRDLIVRI